MEGAGGDGDAVTEVGAVGEADQRESPIVAADEPHRCGPGRFGWARVAGRLRPGDLGPTRLDRVGDFVVPAGEPERERSPAVQICSLDDLSQLGEPRAGTL